MGAVHLEKPPYLLDTHALLFWILQTGMSEVFIDHLDRKCEQEPLLVSTISFWEIALLQKKGKITIENNDVIAWKDELFSHAHIESISPTINDMITSTNLPNIHKDPFDRLLIAQAQNHAALLITRDEDIGKYPGTNTLWMS
jgi:PIN domain nuclease of toxin-antitoxin system